MKNAVENMRICTYGEDGEIVFYCVLTWFIFIVFFSGPAAGSGGAGGIGVGFVCASWSGAVCIGHVNACKRRLHVPSHLDLGFPSREYLAQGISRAKAVNNWGALSSEGARICGGTASWRLVSQAQPTN